MTAIPYRTPACNDHLPDNESDECPWCKLEAAEKEITRMNAGFQGCCLTCESVGELNLKLDAQLEALAELPDKFRNGKIAQLDQAENTRRPYTPDECAAEIENLIDL